MNSSTSETSPDAPLDHGGLPPWEKGELPAPPPFSPGNLFRVIGPGAIMLVASMGGGEWLVGPAIGVQYGMGLFWIATVSIFLQVVFNLESIRYTLYTGEPIMSGIMRLSPGPRFWATVYTILAGFQLGIPALAAACGSVLFAAFAGHMPGDSDSGSLLLVSYGVMALTIVVLLLGRTIERTLEMVSWVMIVLIFTFLLVVNIFYVPAENWMTSAAGFFQFGYIPENIDLVLLGALAATAGSGGIGNLAISNWFRDKGFGMGGAVGAIAGAFGRQEIKLSGIGKIFRISDENMDRWRIWWKYVRADQVWLWGIGAAVGMFLNVNLATGIIPAGTDLSQIGAGAYQAEYLARVWSGFWFLALFNGFWVLFSTHLGNTDILIRTVTDIIWAASPRARQWRGGSVRSIYYSALFGFSIWGAFAINWGTAMDLFKVMANIAGFVLALSAVQILRVNTRFLPKELQPPLWRKVVMVLVTVIFSGMFAVVVWSQLS